MLIMFLRCLRCVVVVERKQRFDLDISRLRASPINNIFKVACVMVAKSSLIYRLDGVPVDNPFTVEQTVRFSECPHAPLNVSTVRLKVARNFISYEGRENIIRYAMTDKVTLSSGSRSSPCGRNHFDPCKEGRSKCGEHSFCRVEGNSFSCACNQG
uniref:(California timema) hypothetical protein n=1 Tax=Timema californicum TaxID=61474 RepID=A0A7R9JLC9_TIMCA|nr:unnamed protein product [Timema californicum]